MGLFTVALACARLASADEYPIYDLAVSFDLTRAKIAGTATIEAKPGARLVIHRGDLRILSLATGGRNAVPDALAPDPLVVQAAGPVRIRYEGTFSGADPDLIDAHRILLRNIWYPVAEGTYRFRLRATVPQDFLAISEGEAVRRTVSRGKATFAFELPYPQRDWDGITFVASRQWVSGEAMYRGIPLTVHLLRTNAGRLGDTLRDAQRYLRQLEALLGAYPFRRLVIAENPVDIGYSLSMPTYILLSQDSVAAEAAEDSALNHEIAHAWFGNGILADYEGGNWAEGLASYFSDHLENERLGRGWERRQRMMAANQSFVAGRAEFPLYGFSQSNDRPSRIIGYAKAAIVIHMLRRLVGDERFFAAMRSFVAENLYRVASWAVLRKAFEREAQLDLGWFFRQWVEVAATPELALEKVSVRDAGGTHELSLTVTQKPPAFSLAVPLTIYFEGGGKESRLLPISAQRSEFRYLLEKKPVRAVFDENYDVFRRLTPDEAPPMIATLLARPRLTLIGTPAEQDKFSDLLEAFEHQGSLTALEGRHQEWARRQPIPKGVARRGDGAPGRAIARTMETSADIASLPTSLILLGEHDPLLRELFGRSVELPRAAFSLTVLKHPRSPGDMVAVLQAASRAQVNAAIDTLVERPRYSAAAFRDGKLVSYELRAGARGISREVAH
ncbi:MAG: hypothetical protein A3G81_13640 [Betaproteobacteria bacterium RIFCSPLOWO2_12_FULL_65_14]|nr:MAG: hypothetical protein A3G81_13640 [Betaproteobacteria bacterium RIFCSPLOWO2_12_FULL_65_14]